MSPSPCLPRETLKGYLNGSADEARLAAIESHLAQCPQCEQTIIELESHPDTLLISMREPADPQSQENSVSSYSASVVQRAVDAARQPGGPVRTPDGPLEKPGEIRPQRIGAYQLLSPLGRGGMGMVLLARHTSLHRQVAIKILPSAIGQRPELVRRFEREMLAAGKLNHPAIVNTTDAGREQGTHYLVMEFIDGLDLSRIARLTGPLPIAEACEIIRQAALGLAYAHGQGIVHRDIKPSNLMLDANGRVKILDFGLAQLSLWEETACELTTVGQLMGTLDYMAPEQAERVGPVDHRADLYALGATLFRLLTGRAPLAASPTMTLLEKVKLLGTQSPPSVGTLREDCPSPLVKLVAQLLARDPAARPASAAHVAEALLPHTSGHQLTGLLQSARAQAQRADEQDALAELDNSSGLTRDTAQPSSSSSQQPPRKWHWLVAAAMLPLLMAAGLVIVLETQKGQLVIESEVPGVEVKIASDDQVVQTMTVQTGAQSTRLRADKYHLTIEGASDAVVIDHNQIEVRRGTTVVARITQKPAATEATRPNSASQANDEDILARRIFSFQQDNYFSEILASLSKTIGREIELDYSDYEAAVGYKQPPERFEIKLGQNEPNDVRSILRKILEPFDLAYAVTQAGQGPIIVGSRARVERFTGKPFTEWPARSNTANSTTSGNSITSADSLASANSITSADANISSTDSSSLLYKGRPLQYWLDTLERDRNMETQLETVPALRELGTAADPQTQAKIREALIQAIVQFTHNANAQRQIQALWYVPFKVHAHPYAQKYADALLAISQPEQMYETFSRGVLGGTQDQQLIGLFVLMDSSFGPQLDRKFCQWLLEPAHFAALDENAWVALLYLETCMGRQPELASSILPELIQQVKQHPKLGLPAVLVLQARLEERKNPMSERLAYQNARLLIEEAIFKEALGVFTDMNSAPAAVALAAGRLASTTSDVEAWRERLLPILDQRLAQLAADQERLLAHLVIVPNFDTVEQYQSGNYERWFPRGLVMPGARLSDLHSIFLIDEPYSINTDPAVPIEYPSKMRYFGSEAVSLMALVSRLSATDALDQPLMAIAQTLVAAAGPLKQRVAKLELYKYGEAIWPFETPLANALELKDVPPAAWRAWKLLSALRELGRRSPDLTLNDKLLTIIPEELVIDTMEDQRWAVVKRQAEESFSSYDGDGDKLLNEEELNNMPMGIKPADADSNGDGKIDLKEFVKLLLRNVR